MINRLSDWQAVRTKLYYGDLSFEVSEDIKLKINISDIKIKICFEFTLPLGDEKTATDKKMITIDIDNPTFKHSSTIELSIGSVSQKLVFKYPLPADIDKGITLASYNTRTGDTPYPTDEGYKLAVLYYGGKLLSGGSDLLVRVNEYLSVKLGEIDYFVNKEN
jgi:hypothetical protein